MSDLFIREIELDLSQPQSDFLVEVGGSVIVNLTPTKQVFVKLDSKTNHPVDLSYIIKLTNANFERLYFTWKKQEGKAKLLVGKFFDVDIATYRLDTLKIRLEELANGILNLISLKTEQLYSEFASIRDLFSAQINAINVNIANLSTFKADITYVESEIARIENLIANQINALSLEVEQLTSNFASFQSAYAETISAINVNIANLNTFKADITYVESEIARVENLIADQITALSLEVDQLTSNFASFQTAYAETINAINVNIANLSTFKADITYVESEIARVENLIANQINALSLEVEQLISDFASFQTAYVETISVINTNVANLNAYKADITWVSGTLASFSQMIANQISSLEAEIEELKARKITADLIEAHTIRVEHLDVQFVTLFNELKSIVEDNFSLLVYEYALSTSNLANGEFYNTLLYNHPIYGPCLRLKTTYSWNDSNVYWNQQNLTWNQYVSYGYWVSPEFSFSTQSASIKLYVFYAGGPANVTAKYSVYSNNWSDFKSFKSMISTENVIIFSSSLESNISKVRFKIEFSQSGTCIILIKFALAHIKRVSNEAGDIPVSNGQLNQNLNADMLDGYHASDFALKTEHEQLKSSHNFLFRVAQKRRYVRPQRVVLQVGNFSGWYGGVYVPWKDQTYCVPRNSSSILVVNNDLSTHQFGNISGSDKYIFGTLAKNGKIYCCPFSATQILVIDPSNNSVELMGDFSGSSKFSAISSVDEWLVLFPWGASYVLKYNITTQEFSTVSVSWNNVMTSLVGPDGWIYFSAQQGSTWNLGKYNPNTDQVIWLQTELSQGHTMGCVWGEKIIFGPRGDTSTPTYRILDLNTGEIRVKTFDVGLVGSWRGHYLGPDGLLYGMPFLRVLLIFDPESETLVGTTSFSSSDYLYVTAPHRRFVFGVPFYAQSLYAIIPYDETQPYS